jgi:hypothetical protein
VNGGSGFARFNKDQGSLPPFYPATVENLGAVKLIKQDTTTGGWLVGGDFDTVNGLSRHALFRLAPGRVVDSNWSAGLGGYYTEVDAMDMIPEADSGGSVMIGGQFEKGLADMKVIAETATGQAIRREDSCSPP